MNAKLPKIKSHHADAVMNAIKRRKEYGTYISERVMYDGGNYLIVISAEFLSVRVWFGDTIFTIINPKRCYIGDGRFFIKNKKASIEMGIASKI